MTGRTNSGVLPRLQALAEADPAPPLHAAFTRAAAALAHARAAQLAGAAVPQVHAAAGFHGATGASLVAFEAALRWPERWSLDGPPCCAVRWETGTMCMRGAHPQSRAVQLEEHSCLRIVIHILLRLKPGHQCHLEEVQDRGQPACL